MPDDQMRWGINITGVTLDKTYDTQLTYRIASSFNYICISDEMLTDFSNDYLTPYGFSDDIYGLWSKSGNCTEDIVRAFPDLTLAWASDEGQVDLTIPPSMYLYQSEDETCYSLLIQDY